MLSLPSAGRWLAILGILLATAIPWPAGGLRAPVAAAQAADCELEAEFVSLRLAIENAQGPEAVGECAEPLMVEPDGDAWQRTERGVFIRIAADGSVAFTDRFFVWRLRDGGLVRALNFDDFPDELEAALGLAPGIPYLFTITGRDGVLEPVSAAAGTFQLRLHVPGGRLMVFSDHPYQRAFQVPVETLVELWEEMGYLTARPTAIISLLDGAADGDALAVTLGEPSYDASQGAVSFAVEVVRDPERLDSELGGFVAGLDSALPSAFQQVSLFISSPPVLFRTTVIMHNETEHALGLADERLADGAWLLIPPSRIAPGGVAAWESQSAGPFLGTAGSVIYFLEDVGPVEIRWENRPDQRNEYFASVPAGYTVIRSGGEDNIARVDFILRRLE